jgi:hypothetical protein
VHDQRDIEDDNQADLDKPEKQGSVFEQYVDLSAEDVLRGGQEDSDLAAPRSGFGHEELT